MFAVGAEKTERQLEGGCRRFSYKKEKVALKESTQNVSRSGEKGWTASLWRVGESRFLYVGIRESMKMF
ncbi:MAG: hypothetical protein DBY44_07630 [Veillonellaceae bacterium]|nr:MAG: hypothetical protein DBY44_07630 [Veillonellaceae bacterium]